MKNKRFKFIILGILVITSITTYFLLTDDKNMSDTNINSDVSNKELLVTEESHTIKKITVNKDVSLIAATPSYLPLEKENSMTELYIRKNSTVDKKVQKSNYQLSFINFEGTAVIDHPENNDKIFATYEYMFYPNLDKGTQEQKLNGFVYTINNDGEVSLLYETKYFFDSMSYENGKLIIYERLSKDTSNRYPSYLKPYERIKMVYSEGKFIEKDRLFINPLEQHKN